MNTLKPTELEEVYSVLAEAIDAAGPERESVFLTKLTLVLANELGDPEAVRQAVMIATQDL